MNSPHSGPINLGNPNEFTIRELANLVRMKVNPDLQLVQKSLPIDDPKQRQPVIDLARRQLNWSPVVPIEEGLISTINYFRSALDVAKDEGAW